MPITAENRVRYPKNWKAISLARKEQAGWICEWCPAEHGKPHPVTGSKVVLTTAHLDHKPENCADDNLRALCQRCHNAYDLRHRMANAALTRRKKSFRMDDMFAQVSA